MPEEPPRPAVPEPPTPEAPPTSILGRPTAIRRPDQPTPDAAQYVIIDTRQVLPSHDPFSFAPNTRRGYPSDVQTRAYERDPAEQAKPILYERQFDPAFVINTSPTAIDGPPIILRYPGLQGGYQYIDLSGNSRDMIIKRLYAHGRGDLYRDPLLAEAESFGISPEAIQSVEQPGLYRVVEIDPTDLPVLQRAVRAYNLPFTQEQTA